MDRRVSRTRQAILQAYRALLQEKGAVVNVQRICQAANIGRSTFYIHFSDRDGLPREMCRELFDHIGLETPAQLPVGETVPDLGALLTVPDKNTGLWRLLRFFTHLMNHMEREKSIYSHIFDDTESAWFAEAFRSGLEHFLDTYVLGTLLVPPPPRGVGGFLSSCICPISLIPFCWCCAGDIPEATPSRLKSWGISMST